MFLFLLPLVSSCSEHTMVSRLEVLLPRNILHPVSGEFLNNANIIPSLPLKIFQCLLLVDRMKSRPPPCFLNPGSLANSSPPSSWFASDVLPIILCLYRSSSFVSFPLTFSEWMSARPSKPSWAPAPPRTFSLLPQREFISSSFVAGIRPGSSHGTYYTTLQ